MERIERLIGKTKDFCDAVIIQDGIDRYYLTGFSSSAGTLILMRDEAVFLVDSRYIQAAREKIRGCRVVLEENRPVQLHGILQDHQVKTVGFETHAVSCQAALQLEEIAAPAVLLRDSRVSDALLAMRMIKDEKELAAFREAQRITDYAFTKAMEKMAPGVPKLEVMMTMGGEMAKAGCERRSFNMILTCGPQTALPHGDPSARLLQKGDFVMMDVGAQISGYAADMTRTVAIGSVSDEQREVYRTVLNAQQMAMDAVKPGMRCRDIDAIARNYIDSTKYRGTFGHGLGHSIGLEMHENPRFNQVCDTILQPGMVMTVEPGIYLPGRFGVRIEDMIEITQDGYSDMTKSPRELVIL